MRILVCGDRNYRDRALIRRKLSEFPKGTVVIEGGGTGADLWAKKEAVALGLHGEEYPARWARYGKSAGPLRNRQMLREGKPDLVLAFHDDLAHSKGTADMVSAAREAGVKVLLITHDGEQELGRSASDTPRQLLTAPA